MKRIGILTLPLHTNYGGLLQAYALQRYLQDNGYNVILLDRKWNKTSKGRLKDFLKKRIFKSKEDELKLIKKHTTYFTEKYIQPKTKILDSEKKLIEQVKELNLDAVVVGSDQVWRLEYTVGFSNNYFLDFLESSEIKKLSYAASFGEDTWNQPQEVTQRIEKLLKKFNSVSVREDSSLKLCKENFNVDAQHHLDPTMLLDISHYKEMVINEKEPKSDGDILIYMLDINEDRQKTIDDVVNHFKGKAFSINVKSNNEADMIEDRTYPTVTSWLKGFIDAKFVITDSFHGSVFAILFNIPFITYGNTLRGLSRFNSLFRTFKLGDRLLLSHSDLKKDTLNELIDWEDVNEEIKIKRLESKEFFKKSLKL